MLNVHTTLVLLTGPLFLILSARCVNADANNYFIWPPAADGKTPTDGGNYLDNVVFTVQANETIRFSTNYSSFTVDLYQERSWNLPTDQHQFIDTIHNSVIEDPSAMDRPTSNESVYWRVDSYNATWPQDVDGVFFFWIQNAADDTQSQFFMSHYFNMSYADASPVNSSAASSPSSASTTGNPNDAALSESNSSDSKMTIRIALGVGLGVGLPLVLLLIWIALRLHKARNRTSSNNSYASSTEAINNRAREDLSRSSTSQSGQEITEAPHGSASERFEIPDHAVHEAPYPEKGDIHEMPDHAVVEAPSDFHGTEAPVTPETAVEVSSEKRFSF